MFGSKRKNKNLIKDEYYDFDETYNKLIDQMDEIRSELKQTKLTLGLVLSARMPEVVMPKRRVRECIDPVLVKRADKFATCPR